MIKKIFVILGWTGLAGFIGFTIWFVYSERQVVRCKSVVVNISPGSPRFMNEQDITRLIDKSGVPSVGHFLTGINIHDLEDKLNAYSTLKNVQVFRKVEANGLSFIGKLVVNVEERTPVLRVKNANDDYYLDREGVNIPVSPNYVDRILIVSGTIPDEGVKQNLLKMADFVNKDDFWRAQIEQVFIRPTGELLLLPQVGDCVIEFGTPDDFREKFRNLKAVYEQGFKYMGWNKYKAISVKYRNEVVCTKK
jgi:cell division protein FtsQ